MSVWRRFSSRKAIFPYFVLSSSNCAIGFRSVPSFSFPKVPSFIFSHPFAEGPMSAADKGTLNAERVANALRAKFGTTDGSMVHVEDTSGGCGAMFHVRVESPQFNGVTRVKQHKMINEVLRSEIRDMHGITIETKAMDKRSDQ